jgi:hypothetical protein
MTQPELIAVLVKHPKIMTLLRDDVVRTISPSVFLAIKIQFSSNANKKRPFDALGIAFL